MEGDVCLPEPLGAGRKGEVFSGPRRGRAGNHLAAIQNHSQDSVQPVVKLLVVSFSATHYGDPTTLGEYLRKVRMGNVMTQKALKQLPGVDSFAGMTGLDDP